MSFVVREEFYRALRNAVDEYRTDVPVLSPEKVVEIFEELKGDKFGVLDIAPIAKGMMYVGIEYPDVDDFWHDWYAEHDNVDGFR